MEHFSFVVYYEFLNEKYNDVIYAVSFKDCIEKFLEKHKTLNDKDIVRISKVQDFPIDEYCKK